MHPCFKDADLPHDPNTGCDTRPPTTTPTMKTILTYIILAIACHSLANAQTKYTVTPIAQGVGNGINNEGDVVGTLSGIFHNDPLIEQHAFLYKGGKLTDLGAPTIDDESGAQAVNDSDEVAGSTATVDGPFIHGDASFYKNGQWVVFATGVTEGAWAEASGINNQGEIVGSYPIPPFHPPLPPFPFHAFVYINGKLVDLGTLGGIDSSASGINNAGWIVGVAENTEGVDEAFIYRNGRMQSIGGSLSSNFVPSAINDNGWITGELNTSTTRNAVLFINDKLYNLGTLAGFTGSTGVSINNSGTVVGNLLGNITNPDNDDVYQGVTGEFVYSNGRMYNLNTVLETGGWKITEVGQINEAGQIAATGTYGGQTITYALLLTPVPVKGQRLP
jgi:probable HAF family extracellular repeat protein